jgi:sugar transferase (PEP-CTERM/EpsH1 system associated)
MPKEMKINVMHVVLGLVLGGLERLVVEISLRMDKDLFNVEVCCLDDYGFFADSLIQRGINVTVVQKNQKRYDPFYPLQLRKFLREKKVHVMHMHSGVYFLASQAGALARTPVKIYTDHGRFLDDSRQTVYEDRFASLFVDQIVAVSKELEKQLVDTIGLPAKKTTTIINGININEFIPREKSKSLMEEFGLRKDQKIVGTVSRLDGIKDQASMIRAYEVVRQRIPESVLMLVGDGPLEMELREQVKQSNLGDSVIFTGCRSDVPALLNLIDVFVLTSLSEGTSISLLEAMASGVVSVVTDVGGNPSIIDNGKDGLLVKPRDIPKIANAITDLLSDSNKCQIIRQNALGKVRQSYSIDKMVENYTNLYFRFLKKKGIKFPTAQSGIIGSLPQ